MNSFKGLSHVIVAVMGSGHTANPCVRKEGSFMKDVHIVEVLKVHEFSRCAIVRNSLSLPILILSA